MPRSASGRRGRAGQDPAAPRHLVEHCATAGTLDECYHDHLTCALELESLTIADIGGPTPARAPSRLTPSRMLFQEISRTTGHLRLLIRDRDGVHGMVNVRDSLTAAPRTTATDLKRPVLTTTTAVPVYEASRTMRETRNRLAVVTAGDPGELVGLVTITDVLQRLLPAATVGVERAESE